MRNFTKNRAFRFGFWLTFLLLAVFAVVFHYLEPVFLFLEIMLDFYFLVGSVIIFLCGMILFGGISLYYRRRSGEQSDLVQNEESQTKRSKLQCFRTVFCRIFCGLLWKNRTCQASTERRSRPRFSCQNYRKRNNDFNDISVQGGTRPFFRI